MACFRHLWAPRHVNPRIQGISPALAYLLVLALIIINAWRSVRVKVKGKPYHPDTAACLPALMQTLCFDVPGLDIVNLAEMIPCVLRYAENVNQRLVVAVLIPRLFQFLKIKLLMFLVCKNHVCVVGALRPCS